MKQDIGLATACGLYCGECDFLGEQCAGCGPEQGKPFWTEQFGMDVCPIYGCCDDGKRLEHCGLCDGFPCESFTSLRDPSRSDEEFERSLRQREADLVRRKEIGTAAWLKEEDSA